MSHYILELAIWVFGAYGLGCMIGASLRSRLGK
jgi:hypothetical protein